MPRKGEYEKWISIHAPRVRCDDYECNRSLESDYFNPRTSCEVRLKQMAVRGDIIVFQSTHLV